MLSISHALTGGFIAAKLSHPVLFIPLTLASHYLEDWIPHRDVGTGLSTGRRKKSTAIILELGELAITVGLIYVFWQRGQAEIQWHIWLAGFVALVPDFLEAPKNFLNWDPWFLKPFNDFHHSFHHSTMNWVVGLTPQIILVAMIWFLR
jgi:hypothetical protein